MRCPKCGYISYDHLTACAKCGRDVSELAAELQGTSIKTEAPMFLSGALGAFSGEEEETFEEQALEADMDEGIDFSMEEEGQDVDFSFEEEGEEEADISLAEAEAEEAATMEAGEDVDFDLGVEEAELPEEEMTETLAAEGAEAEEIEEAEEEETGGIFEELDLSGTVDDGEEGGLEFDLEDFMEDTDEDTDIDLGPDKEK
jgi:hypothetical protein